MFRFLNPLLALRAAARCAFSCGRPKTPNSRDTVHGVRGVTGAQVADASGRGHNQAEIRRIAFGEAVEKN
jgi:hypothetical protein